MLKPISIRDSLITNLVMLIVILGGAITAAMIFSTTQQVKSLSKSFVDHALSQTHLKLSEFFYPITQSLEIARQWGTLGLLNVDDPESLTRLLLPIVEQYPQVSSLLLADERGHEFMLLHLANGWYNRISKPDEWGDKSKIIEWSDINKPKSDWKILSYDPRKRPWYQGAMQLEQTKSPYFWTNPYTFFTTKEPGITVSTTFHYKNRIYVIGFDVLLNDITKFTQNLNTTAQAKTLVITEKGLLIGLPMADHLRDKAQQQAVLLKHLSVLNMPVVNNALKVYQSLAKNKQGPFTFSNNDELWWGGGVEYRLTQDQADPTQSFWIAVLIPEADVLGDVLWVRYAAITMIFIVLVVSLYRATHMAKRYSKPIEALVDDSYRMSQGDLEPRAPIHSRIQEVQQLAYAHDSMRKGLRTLLKLERDMQLAKIIQRDTIPNQLPALNRYQIATWNQPADETGGDTFDVIGLNKQTLEFTQAGEQASKLVMMLADATGHGIGPALSVTQVRSMLRMAVGLGGDLESILRFMNQQLCADLSGGRFITLWLGTLDTDANQLITFSAGQAPLLYYKADEEKVTVLSADSPPLGITNELVFQVESQYTMRSGDIYIVMSDGIYEATNAQGEAFGMQRVIDLIQQHAKLTPKVLLKNILTALNKFTDHTAAADDQTAVIIKRA